MWYLQYWESLIHTFQFALKEVGPCHEVLKGKLPLARDQTAPELWQNWPLCVCTLLSKDCITATDLSKCFLYVPTYCCVTWFQLPSSSSMSWFHPRTGLGWCYEGKERQACIIFLMMTHKYVAHYQKSMKSLSFVHLEVEMQILFIIFSPFRKDLKY